METYSSECNSWPFNMSKKKKSIGKKESIDFLDPNKPTFGWTVIHLN